MATTYINAGDVIEYVALATTTSGDVITLDDTIGIALASAASGAKVSVQVSGNFTLDKATGVVFATGQKLNWDASTGKVTSATTSAAGDVTAFGIAAAVALTGDTTCEVILCPGNGTGT